MPSIIFKIESGKFGLSLTDPGGDDVCAAQLGSYSDFTCQITSGALTASPNVSQETVPATWCEPEQQVPQVGQTSYSLDMTFLQDPQIVDGISRFLFEHDTEAAWFFMGLDGDDPPKATGQLRVVSGAIGGAGRTTLTSTVSLPVDGKPAVCFGDATSSVPINNPPDPLDVTVAFFGATPAPFATLVALGADAVYGDDGSSPTLVEMTLGQYAVLNDGPRTRVSYESDAWATGAATG